MGESDIIYLRVFVPDFVRALLRVAVLRSIIEFLEARMSLKVRAVLVVVIGLVLGLSLSVGGGLIGNNKAPDKEELAWEQARLFAEVLERVKRDYVEPIDDAELLESAIRGMVSDLDAHSQYLDAGEYRDIRISTTGSYTGIGIEVDEVGDPDDRAGRTRLVVQLLPSDVVGEIGVEHAGKILEALQVLSDATDTPLPEIDDLVEIVLQPHRQTPLPGLVGEPTVKGV